MRPVLILGLLGLAACATPQEACISRAGEELKVIDKLIATTRGNLARGYAIETQQILVNTEQVCGKDTNGDDILCQVAVSDEKKVPVAIDLKAEAQKLESMLARRQDMQNTYQAQVRQCVSQYPDA